MKTDEMNYPPGIYLFTVAVTHQGMMTEEKLRVPEVTGHSKEEWLNLSDDKRAQELNKAWLRWTIGKTMGGFFHLEHADQK